MNATDIKEYQKCIWKWQPKFNVLWSWDIRALNDGENFCRTRYNIDNHSAIIYPCDIDVIEDYVLHEMVKIAMIASQSMDAKLVLIEDICSLIKTN